MRDTPETKAFKTRIRGIDGDKHWVPAGFAEILERERDEARHKLELCMAANSDVARIAKERDEAREAWYQMQSSFERSRDEVERVIRERDEARHKLELCMAANSDVARIAKERDEAITRRMETIMQCELYEQERDEAREQVKELIYIAERAIALAEIDFENDKFGVVSELRDGLERIKEGAK
jgi:hypothetical protein